MATARSKTLQILRWLLAPLLLLIGKRRRREERHQRLEDRLEEDHRLDEGTVHLRSAALSRQLAEAQQADAMEGGLGLGRGNDLAARMYNEFVDEQSDNMVTMFGDFLLGVLKARRRSALFALRRSLLSLAALPSLSSLSSHPAPQDPDAPASTHRAIERHFATVWPDVRDRLKWDLAGDVV